MAAIRFVILASVISIAFVSLLGCSGPSTPADNSDIRQARLWAEENLKEKENIEELKSQVAAQKEEISGYKAKINKIENQMQAKCEKEKEEIQKANEESAAFLMEQLPGELVKQVTELTKENEALKLQIEQLNPKK